MTKADRKRFQIDINMIRMYQKPCWHIYKIEEITTLAGATKGFADGAGDQAKFCYPDGICWNPYDKCLYLCDTGNNAIRRITLQGSFIFSFHHLFITLTDKCMIRTSQHACARRIVVLPNRNSHALQNKHLLRDKSGFALSLQDLSIR